MNLMNLYDLMIAAHWNIASCEAYADSMKNVVLDIDRYAICDTLLWNEKYTDGQSMDWGGFASAGS